MNNREIISQFPILNTQIHGKRLVYLDNGASTQKPQSVIDRLVDYYQHLNSNVHRGVHTLSQNATNAFENARSRVQEFINAEHQQEIIFTKGATESLNLLASCLTETLKPGDQVLITQMEHHANIVPWQIACQRSGAQLRVWPITDQGGLDLSLTDQYLTPKVKVFSITHTSNVLGTVNPLEILIPKAHAMGCICIVDAAQAPAHSRLDVRTIDCDFLVFSGHKMYAPMGTGILFGKLELLNALPPYQYGGEMIEEVTFEQSRFLDAPFRFEAGTPNVADFLGLETAIDFINSMGIEDIAQHESTLLHQATVGLQELGQIQIYGQTAHKAGVLSFNIDGVHPYDVGVILDHMGVAVRTGHHCAQPLMQRLGIPGTVRASFALYNNSDDVQRLIEAVAKAKQMLL